MHTRREGKEIEHVHNMATPGGSTEEVDFIHDLHKCTYIHTYMYTHVFVLVISTRERRRECMYSIVIATLTVVLFSSV